MQSSREKALSNMNEKMARTKSYQERSVPKFLKKVFYILEDNKHNEYVSWSNDGAVMIVKKPTEFAERVLPLYFKHNNFASFVRQLNMYNFKKKKNYHYDHAYAHDMFQTGKIDLLRNIHRKAADSLPMIPSAPKGFKACKEDAEINVDGLIQDNLQYKDFHKTLLTQVRFIENKMKALKNEVQELHSEQERLKMNEQFLKNVVKNVSKVVGAENMKKIIEAESLNCASLTGQTITHSEKVPKSVNQNLVVNSNHALKSSYAPEAYYDEMDIIRKIQHVEERDIRNQYPAKHLSLNNYSLPYAYTETDHSNGGSSEFQQAHQIENGLDNDESDQVDNTRSEHLDTYTNWLMKFERQQLSNDAFLGAALNQEYRNLDIDDIFTPQNQSLPRYDF